MARKANPSKKIVELPAPNEQGINEVMNTMTTIQSEYNQGRDLLNRIIGRIQLSETYENLSRTVRVSEMAYIKESKSYKYLKGQQKSERSVFSGTWEEFCTDVLKISVDKADTDINNLKAFGEEALESMSNMGIGYRELRQYRKLPEDQKTALIEVAKAGDKEALVELAEEFITKNDKEKALLKKQVDDAKKELEISEAYNADTRKERDDLKLKLKKYELNTISIEEQIESLELSIDINKDIYKPFNHSLNTFRSIIEHFRQQTFNAMENDPDFQKGDMAKLPDIMVDQLTLYHGLLIQMLNDIRVLHYNFSDEFSAYIDDKRNDMERTAYENLMAIENGING